ncbi:Transcriptional regulator SlyA [subsurface metagenome]
MYVTEVLRDLSCQLQALIRRLAHTHELTPTQAHILLTLPVDGLSMSALARCLGLDASTMSRVIDKMAEQYWVQRQTSVKDRRVIQVVRTSLGHEIRRRLYDDMEQLVQELLRDLPPEREELLSQLLADLSRRLIRLRS